MTTTKTRQIEARELAKGMTVVDRDGFDHEVTRVKQRPTSVTMLLDGTKPFTLRPSEMLVIKEA